MWLLEIRPSKCVGIDNMLIFIIYVLKIIGSQSVWVLKMCRYSTYGGIEICGFSKLVSS